MMMLGGMMPPTVELTAISAAEVDKAVGDLAMVHDLAGEQEKWDGDKGSVGDGLLHLVGDGDQGQLAGNHDVNGRDDHHDETDGGAEHDENEQNYDQEKGVHALRSIRKFL
jgi:hypothetical protein